MNIFSHPSYPVMDGYLVIGYNSIVSRAKGNSTSIGSVTIGSHTVTYADASFIVSSGDTIDIEPGTLNHEAVVVTSTGSGTFTATFTIAHNAGFCIQNQYMMPSYFGPWKTLSSNYTSNLSIVDTFGSKYDLYRVQPIVQKGTDTPITLDFSRVFYADTPLYDCQVSALMENCRINFLDDPGVKQTDSTVLTESTGQGVMPFITDSNTARFYLSFLPNSDPVKFRESDVLVLSGSKELTAKPLRPYIDYFPNISGGFIDFAVNPSVDTYLKIEYTTFDYADDEVRSALTNSVRELSLFGLTNASFEVLNSNNYHYLKTNIPDGDVAQIMCKIAQMNMLGAKIHSSFKSSEAWKLGKGVEYTADPSRSIQAGTLWHTDLRKQIQKLADNYIINNRQYFSRGEFDSFFDNSGILYPPFSVYNVFNYMSWWM